MNLELKIEQAIEEFNKLINNFDKSKSDKMNISITQVERIIHELAQMKISMDPKTFFPSYGHMIIDSWDPDEESKLRDELILIEHAYKKIK
jgi:hypothetical protein